jgi:hypothetical protein
MMTRMTFHFQAGDQPRFGRAADVIQCLAGGELAVVDERRKPVSDQWPAARFAPSRLQDVVINAMCCRQRYILDVAASASPAVTRFLLQRPGTIGNARVCLSVSSDEAQLQRGATLVKELIAAGMHAAQLSVIQVTDDPTPADAVLKVLLQHLPSSEDADRVRRGRLSPELLDSALQLGVAVGACVHRAIDFESLLEDALRTGAPEDSVRTLAKKVLAQRMISGAATELKQLSEALDLATISREEWLHGADGGGARAQDARFSDAQPADADQTAAEGSF